MMRGRRKPTRQRLDASISLAARTLTALLAVEGIIDDEPINDDLDVLEEQSSRHSIQRFPAQSAAQYTIGWIERNVPAGVADDLLIQTLEALRDVIRQVSLALPQAESQ